jgi:hypothetical protein
MTHTFTMAQAAHWAGVSLDTIKRRHRAGAFPNAKRGPAKGRREAPWLIPIDDLVAAGLTPDPQSNPNPDDLDPAHQLAHARGVITAQEAHLADMRVQLKRLTEALVAATGVAGDRGSRNGGLRHSE